MLQLKLLFYIYINTISLLILSIISNVDKLKIDKKKSNMTKQTKHLIQEKVGNVGSDINDDLMMYSTRGFNISDVDYKIPIRTQDIPLGGVLLLEKRYEINSEFYTAIQNPGNGHCPSYSVNNQRKKGDKMLYEFKWASIDELSVSVFVILNVETFICYDEVLNHLYIYKNPSLNCTRETIMVVHQNDHFVTLTKLKELKDARLVVNYPIQIHDLKNELGDVSISPKVRLLLDPVSSQNTNLPVLEFLLFNRICNPISRTHLVMILENLIEDHQRQSIIDYIDNPSLFINNCRNMFSQFSEDMNFNQWFLNRIQNVGSYISPDTTCDYNDLNIDSMPFKDYHIINNKVNDPFPLVNGLYKHDSFNWTEEYEHPSYEGIIELYLTNLDTEQFNYNNLPVNVNESSSETGETSSNWGKADISDTVKLKTGDFFNSTIKGMPTDELDGEANLSRAVSKLTETTPKTITSWPLPSKVVPVSKSGKTFHKLFKDFLDCVPAETEVADSIRYLSMMSPSKEHFLIRGNAEEDNQFKEIDRSESTKSVKLAMKILRTRGNVFENLIRYGKGFYSGERTMAEFILELNRKCRWLSSRLFSFNIESAKTNNDLMEIINNNYKGTIRSELMNKVFTKTPDIVHVSIRGEWLDLVICDPSSGNDIISRKKSKTASYNIFRNLLNSSSLVNFQLESPVINGLASNMQEALSEVILYEKNLIGLPELATAFIRTLTTAFNTLRKYCPSVQQYYTCSSYEVEMGDLKDIDFVEFLKDRDLELAGLNKEEARELFSDKLLSYERKEHLKSIEDTFLKTITEPVKGKGVANSDREDIFLDTDSKIRQIDKAFNSLLSEEAGSPDKSNRPDPIGHFPIVTRFSKAKKVGLVPALDSLEGVKFKGQNSYVSNLLQRLAKSIEDCGREEFDHAISLDVERNRLTNKDKVNRERTLMREASNKLDGFNIKGKNRLSISKKYSNDWVIDYSESKKKKYGSNRGFMKEYNKRSINRIDNFIEELEEPSLEGGGNLEDVVDACDISYVEDIVANRITEYISSKGSQALLTYHKVCFELNLLLSTDMRDGEIAISNLGMDNMVALVSPGPSLSDSSSTRHVKFIIKKEDRLKGQCFDMSEDEDGTWLCQEGFSKITHKGLMHLLNMKLCLLPLYNELSGIGDSKVDKEYKRSFHQLLWMVGDSTTNKILGVVRYLFLLVFAKICNPKNLILDELGINEVVWKKDIHIYLVHKMKLNLSNVVKEASSVDESAIDDDDEGVLVQSTSFKMPRLLYSGNHRNFTEMLNEFYLYYTWNKLQVDNFTGTKKIFNKLIKMKSKCEKYIKPCIERLRTDREFGVDEFHLNTGVRIGTSKVGNPELKRDMNYLLKGVKEGQPGVGYAPFLYYSTQNWFDEMEGKEILSSMAFNPLTKCVTDLSNTRGSLERTDIIENDSPIVCDKLKRISGMTKATEKEKRKLQSSFDQGKLTLEKFKDDLGILEEIRDIEVEEKLYEPRDGLSYTREMDIDDGKPSKMKRDIANCLGKLGYDKRSKCITTCRDEIFDYIKKKTDGINDYKNFKKIEFHNFIHKFVTNKLDMLHGLSPKTQHLSDRELRIMDMLSKAGVRVIEDLSRFICSIDKRETTTTEKYKQSAQVRNSKFIDTNCRLHNKFGIKLSADKSKWGPGVLPTEFIPILRCISHNLPNLSKICKLCMFMCIKLQSKRVIVPKEMLSYWWVHDLNLPELSRTQPELAQFIGTFDPRSRSTFDNINDMGQGVLNSFTSYKHLISTTTSNKLYYELCPKTRGIVDRAILSSDDSLEMQTFDKENLKGNISTWLTVKTGTWRLHNMISNKKKTCGSDTLSEYNSNFHLRPICSPPSIKQIVAAGSLNFSYSWADTVRGKLSEIKSASENGVTNSTCLLLNIMNKSLYCNIFGITKIKNVLGKLCSVGSMEVINSMESGHIEFGRFPIVDIVKLNVMGNYEIMLDGLRNKRQTQILTDLSDNTFFAPGDEDHSRHDLNSIGMKSMKFRLFKIDKLDNQRKLLKKQLEEINYTDEDCTNVLKRNPFAKNMYCETISEQLLQIKDTLMSSSMQTAYSNFDGLKGMMRVFGMKYSANYGCMNTKTENCSFMMIMVLMNLSCFYEFPNKNEFFKNLNLSRSSEESDLDYLKIMTFQKRIKVNYKYPKPIEVLRNICEDSVSTINIEMSKDRLPGNSIQPTLMRRPQWNNMYQLSSKPISSLRSHWNGFFMLDKTDDPKTYDKFVLEKRFHIHSNPIECAKDWGLTSNKETIHEVVPSIISWLTRLVESSYKPPRLIYGRATSKSGIKKMASDLYCFNSDTDYYIKPTSDIPQAPNNWTYSEDEYNYYLSCCLLMPFCENSAKFKSTCMYNLRQLNEIRRNQKENSTDIIINPNIISDTSAPSDIRYVVSCLKCDINDRYSLDIRNILLKCLKPKTHTYIIPQEKNKKEDSFIVDTSCLVQYFTASEKMKVIAFRDKRPYIEYSSDRKNLNNTFIAQNVKDFFLSRAYFSYTNGEKIFSEKFLKLSEPKMRKKHGEDRELVGFYDLPSSKLLKNKTTYCLPIFFISDNSDVRRPVIDSKITFQNNWENKEVKIITDSKVPENINFVKTVLRYEGNSMFVNLSSITGSAVLNGLINNSNIDNNLDKFIQMKYLSDSTKINFHYGQYSGATIALLCKLKEDTLIKKYNFEDLIDTFGFKNQCSKFHDFCKLNDLDIDKICKDLNFDMHEFKLPIEIETEVDLKQEPKLFRRFNFDQEIINTLSLAVDSTNIVRVEDSEPIEEMDINFYFGNSGINVETRKERFAQQYYRKWKDYRKDNLEKKSLVMETISKEFAEQLVRRKLKDFDKKINRLFKKLKEANQKNTIKDLVDLDNEYIEKIDSIDKVAATCIDYINYLESDSYGSNKIPNYETFIEQVNGICNHLYDKHKVNPKYFKMVVSSKEMDSLDHIKDAIKYLYSELDVEFTLDTDLTKDDLIEKYKLNKKQSKKKKGKKNKGKKKKRKEWL